MQPSPQLPFIFLPHFVAKVFEKIVCIPCLWFLVSLKSNLIIFLSSHSSLIETALVRVIKWLNSKLNSQPSFSWLINNFWDNWTLPAPWYTFSLPLASRFLHSPGCQKYTPQGSLLCFSQPFLLDRSRTQPLLLSSRLMPMTPDLYL